MATAEAPLPAQKLLCMPLIVALSILTCVAMTLLALHFMVTKLCAGHRRTAPSAQGEADGIQKAVLDSIPVHAYTGKQGGLPMEQCECSVCLGELEEGQLIRALPGCGHIFHAKCIDAWFAERASCPVCRAVIPPPEALVLAMDVIGGPSVFPLALDHQSVSVSSGGGETNNASRWSLGSCLMACREKLRMNRVISMNCFNDSNRVEQII